MIERNLRQAGQEMTLVGRDELQAIRQHWLRDPNEPDWHDSLPAIYADVYPDDEIDLKELFMVLWGGKWLISAVTGLAAVISVVVALSLPNIYTASALLAPAESGGDDKNSGLEMVESGAPAAVPSIAPLQSISPDRQLLIEFTNLELVVPPPCCCGPTCACC